MLWPNLSFTVENKGNFHKIRLVTFQTSYNEWNIFLNFIYLSMKMNRENEISVGKNGILNPWKFCA